MSPLEDFVEGFGSDWNSDPAISNLTIIIIILVIIVIVGAFWRESTRESKKKSK